MRALSGSVPRQVPFWKFWSPEIDAKKGPFQPQAMRLMMQLWSTSVVLLLCIPSPYEAITSRTVSPKIMLQDMQVASQTT